MRQKNQATTYPIPTWIDKKSTSETELCPDCFKAVGVRSRYKLICILGKSPGGITVTGLAKKLKLTQPTVTHHLQILSSLHAVSSTQIGRESIYKINRKAHCFDECKIPI